MEGNFDPSSFVRVRTIAEIENLSEDTDVVFVFESNDKREDDR
jgi:hypothetical protein